MKKGWEKGKNRGLKLSEYMKPRKKRKKSVWGIFTTIGDENLYKARRVQWDKDSLNG